MDHFHRRSFFVGDVDAQGGLPCLSIICPMHGGTLIYRDNRKKPVKEQTNGFCAAVAS